MVLMSNKIYDNPPDGRGSSGRELENVGYHNDMKDEKSKWTMNFLNTARNHLFESHRKYRV